MTLLAPDSVEAILDGRQPAEMTLAVLMQPFAVGWDQQREMWDFAAGDGRWISGRAPDCSGL